MIARRVRRAYDRRARRYDAIVRLLSLGRDAEYRRRAVAELKLVPGDRVLDVGCGTGLNFRWLAREVGPEGLLVGTDPCRGMLEQVGAGPRLAQAAASQDVFRPGSFDAVICTYVISTMLDSPSPCLQTPRPWEGFGGQGAIGPIARVLRPGGRLVIVDDALPPGWYVGPCFMLEGLARRGWPDLRRATLEALKRHFRDLRTWFCHFGMIWGVSATRR